MAPVTVASMAILPILFVVLVGALVIGGTILWIWMIIDCATNESAEGDERLIWILIIVLTHWIGALIYFLVRRPKRIQESGR